MALSSNRAPPEDSPSVRWTTPDVDVDGARDVPTTMHVATGHQPRLPQRDAILHQRQLQLATAHQLLGRRDRRHVVVTAHRGDPGIERVREHAAEQQHVKQPGSNLGVRLRSTWSDEGHVRVSFGSRLRNAEVSCVVRVPLCKTTGLPAAGAVLVAGAVAMPTVTSETWRMKRNGKRSPGTTSCGAWSSGCPFWVSASSAG